MMDRNQLYSRHNNFAYTNVNGLNNDNNENANRNNKKYVDTQKSIINKNNTNIPKNYNPPYNEMYAAIPGIFGKRFPPKETNPVSTRYDPIGDFMFRNGLYDRDNTIRYYTNYINVDSTFRSTVPVAVTDSVGWIQLGEYPLSFTFNSNLMRIVDMGKESNIAVDDKIMLSGVLPIVRRLRTIFDDENKTKLFEFTRGSKYMKINYKHFMKFPYEFSDIINYDRDVYIENYDTVGVEVEIQGIQGELDSNYIGNIPIGTLNAVHRVFLYNPDSTVAKTYSDDSFYIELVSPYNNEKQFVLQSYNVQITYHYIAGIPINEINAEYPIDSNHIIGYHRVSAVDSQDSFTVSIPKIATLVDESISYIDTTGQYVGGNGGNIYIAKIEEIQQSFPNPNHYILQLPYIYTQVVYIKMISSEFPNIQDNIISTGTKKNNRLYWQNLEDGNVVYYIELDSGTYDPEGLQFLIDKKISEIPRSFSRNINPNNNNIRYTQFNIIKTNIDQATNIVTFSSYTEAVISKPFTRVSPPIEKDVVQIGLLKYTITIGQINHRLSRGNKITISGALSYYGIPASVLNGDHYVDTVIDDNQYTIVVQDFNLEENIVDTGGGYAVYVLTPNTFRLRFDYSDTMGKLLGFRNVGSSIAITKYGSTVTNKDEYEKELGIDEEGATITYENNSLLFSADNYILVVCKQIEGIYSFGQNKSAFAKIILPDPYGISGYTYNCNDRLALNTYVETPIYFHNPIKYLKTLEFEFYSPDGELYDFNGLDHSFTIEIVTLNDSPKGTGITSFSGIIN